jgi:hypothetical protein
MDPSERGEVYAIVIHTLFQDVVNHYDGFVRLGLTEQVRNELIQHLPGSSPAPREAVHCGFHA